MAESKLKALSMEFSVDIIGLVKDLKAKHESIIANQIGRSGTSIGANIHEAQYAQGKRDFISKLETVGGLAWDGSWKTTEPGRQMLAAIG